MVRELDFGGVTYTLARRVTRDRHDRQRTCHQDIHAIAPSFLPSTAIRNGRNAGERHDSGQCKFADRRCTVKCHSHYPQFNGTGNFIHKIPAEILLNILRLRVPPRTRKGMHRLSKLTRVCRFWRAVLINQPRMWSTIFAKREDSRGFAEMCVERSQTTPLDVTVDASGWGLVHPGCTCDTDGRERLLPNERNPCEWHFAFEVLTSPKHSTRIQTLDIDFKKPYYGEMVELALGSCRFFALSFPQLITLRWNAGYSEHSKHTFSRSPFTPTIRSLSFNGSWDDFFTQANNLTSLTLVVRGINAEAFRLFMLSNQSIESLSLDFYYFRSDLNGPPVDLLNLKSFTLRFCPASVSEIIRVPALQHLSSLEISLEGIEDITQVILTAAVDGFIISVKTFLRDVIETWEGLTRDAPPTIRHVRYWKYSEARDLESEFNGHAVIPLLADAHTLEIGRGYLLSWYPAFLDDLKQLGPQLKTIRFEIPETKEPFEWEDWDGRRRVKLLDQIEELVKSRFEHGYPFSAVERMVVDKTGRVSGQRDHVWRCFYDSRGLDQYVRPE